MTSVLDQAYALDDPAPLRREPPLPTARGPLSAAVLDRLRSGNLPSNVESLVAGADPFGEDVQLALYVGYELHYRGFAGVGGDAEWDPELLGLRQRLEALFEAAVRREVAGGADVDAAVAELLVEPTDGEGTSWFLRREGERWQLREYLVHRSIYHLKEADPQAWVIPRLDGPAKAALVTVEHDEYGAGRGERMHAALFADMMAEQGLDPTYGAYLDHAPAATLAETNFMSLCGLHRSHRGASVGQFALVELTSSPGSARMVAAAARLGAGPATVEFYAEHVEADAVHEQVVRRAVLAPLLAAEPELAADVVFGIQGATLLADRSGGQLLADWRAGRSSLRHPLP